PWGLPNSKKAASASEDSATSPSSDDDSDHADKHRRKSRRTKKNKSSSSSSSSSTDSSDSEVDVKSKAKKSKKKCKKRYDDSSTDESDSSDDEDDDTGLTSKDLGKISLPKFDGEPAKYHQWLSEFKFLVHKSSKVKHAIKFLHRRRCLTGKAKSYIEELTPSKQNYKKVIRRLREHYENVNTQRE